MVETYLRCGPFDPSFQIRSRQFFGYLLDLFPGLFHMMRFGMGLADTEPEREPIVQGRVGQIQFATSVKSI